MSASDLIPHRGAVAKSLLIEVVRELAQSDLLRLGSAEAEARSVSNVPPVKRIRAIHHRQAILLARGLGVAEVAAIVGSTPQRISDLQNHDPAFKNLLAIYTDQINVALVEDSVRLKSKLLDAGEMALDEIIARLEDEGKVKAIPIDSLRKIVESGADRTVAPPLTTNSGQTLPAAITINFGTKLRDISKEGIIIEHEPKALEKE